MIVANMNLHEVYATLMSEMPKLEWKRDALLSRAIKEIKKIPPMLPAFMMYDYKIPSSNNQYIIYFYRELSPGPGNLIRVTVKSDFLFVLFDNNKRFVIKWAGNGAPEIHVLTSHFLQRYRERFLKQTDLTANEVAVRYLSRNYTMRPMAIDERINKHIKNYGEFAGEGFLVQDGFCFKLSGEETTEGGEHPIRISFYTTFMPLTDMSESQREAIFEECMKDVESLEY